VQVAGRPADKEANLRSIERLVRRAATLGAVLVATPEVVTTGFVGGDVERGLAEPIPGPTTVRLGALAAELDLHLLVGMSEAAGGEIANAVAVLGPDGAVRGVMRKVHINRHELAGGWRNGSQFPVWDIDAGSARFRLGVMICYDREHPESARALMVQGADLIVAPLACECPVDDIHRALLRTRAFENAMYLQMVNHAEPAQNGHSMFIDDSGTICAEADHAEAVLVWTADFDALRERRTTSIYGINHRRPDAYDLLVDPSGQRHPAGANLPPDSTLHRLPPGPTS
jgi:predicted amidohydrolase